LYLHNFFNNILKIPILIIIVLILIIIILKIIPDYLIIIIIIYFLFSANDFKILTICIFSLFLEIIKEFPILPKNENIKNFLIILISISIIRNFRNISIFIFSLI
jgi:hypothetical protein